MDNALIFLNHKKPVPKTFLRVFHVLCALVVLVGAIIPMDVAWAAADITMGGMTLINLPACVLLGSVAFRTLADYERQKKEGKDPVFLAKQIGLDENELDYWK